MLSIQDVGTEILEGRPKKFYVMTGSEYGIKLKYIQMIADAYRCDVRCADSVAGVLNVFSSKRLFPLNPSVYVIRYDEEFVNSLDTSSAQKIDACKIVGCVVCLYEAEKHSKKLDKFLPNHTVSIDAVNPRFMQMYLHKDFPRVPDKLIDASVAISSDYNQAQNVCRCMSYISAERLVTLSDTELYQLFGKSFSSSDAQIRVGFAAKNFSYLVDALDSYSGDLDSLFYCMLSTLVELEKILVNNRHIESQLLEYSKGWTMKDIYNMFNQVYDQLWKLRSISSDASSSLIYLFSLLQYREIPSTEEML